MSKSPFGPADSDGAPVWTVLISTKRGAKHGTWFGFVRDECRCAECVAAVPHGTLDAYLRWHCSCSLCGAVKVHAPVLESRARRMVEVVEGFGDAVAESEADRIARLEAEAHALLDEAIEREVKSANRCLAGIVLLFSGGNDSTTLAHLFKDRATHTAHANTGIGIEQTREYVRETSAAWGLPLLERMPRFSERYEDLVLGRVVVRNGPKAGKRPYPGGFPGPAMHYMMFQRLKERSLERIRSEIVEYPYQQRVIFLAGRRAQESGRRQKLALKDAIERRGSTVWVSPLINWTKEDLNAYRRIHPDVPRNEVSDLLHMSGECLCGSFAHSGELEEIEMWFPEFVEEIRALEKQVAAADVAPPERCKWGWGAGKEAPSKVGALCSSCDARFEQLSLIETEA